MLPEKILIVISTDIQLYYEELPNPEPGMEFFVTVEELSVIQDICLREGIQLLIKEKTEG